MAEKSPDAFRTISEVAEELKLPQHVLRFWETRFPQIKPLKRAGGRRFYRPDDVALLRAIKALLYGRGYTIKGVLRLLQEQGVRGVTNLVPSSETVADATSGATEGVDIRFGRSDGDAPEATAAASLLDDGPLLPDDLVRRLEAIAAALKECRQVLATVRPPRD